MKLELNDEILLYVIDCINPKKVNPSFPISFQAFIQTRDFNLISCFELYIYKQTLNNIFGRFLSKCSCPCIEKKLLFYFGTFFGVKSWLLSDLRN